MSMIKRLWKRGTRRHPSPNNAGADDDRRLPQSAASSSSSLVGLGAPIAVAGLSSSSGGRAGNNNQPPFTSPGEAEAAAQQEALIAALQSTVLEQRRRLQDLEATVDRLHGDARRQGFHVEALQRLLHQLTCADGGEGEGCAGEEGEGQGGIDRSSRRRVRRLAPTPAPPMWGSSSATAVSGATEGEAEDEGSGLYSYISGFLGGAASTLLPSALVEEEAEAPEPASAKAEGQQGQGQLVPAYHVQAAAGRSKMDLEDAQALLMSQILEKLHLAEDRYHFQAEEIHALQSQLREREQECLRLRAERARHALLLHGLKRELSAYRHKLRDRDVKEASLEVQLDRARLEKRSLTRLMSEAATATATEGPLTLPPPTPSPFFGPSGPGSAPASYSYDRGGGETGAFLEHLGQLPPDLSSPSRFSLPAGAEAFPLPSPREREQPHTGVASSLQQLDRMIGESGGAPAAPSPTAAARTPKQQLGTPQPTSSLGGRGGSLGMAWTPTPDSQGGLPAVAAQHIGQLRVEVAALHAELEAARAVSEVEVRKRVAAEHEAATLQQQLREAQAQLQREQAAVPLQEEDREGEGEGKEEVSEEMAALVLKEQLSALRELKPAFHETYGGATTEFKVRGPSYMADGVKITDDPPPLFELVHMELLDVASLQTGETRADHVTALFQARGADGAYARCRTLASVPPPFLLILNFQVPGNPPCSMMAYFALSGPRRRRLEALQARLRAQNEKGVGRDEAKTQGGLSGEGLVLDDSSQDGVRQALFVEEGGEGAVDAREEKALRLLAAFLEGDDAYRNARFKLIPSVVEGPFLIRMSVGNKPVLLGTKLTQRYWSGPGYLEVGIDIGSSSVASSVLGLVRDYSKNIVVEIAVLVQGENGTELPERLLGSVRCSRLDWSLAESLAERLVPSPPNSGASSSSLAGAAGVGAR